MKYTFSRTYKAGRLTVNLYPREILLIYTGRRRNIIRSFRRPRFPWHIHLKKFRPLYMAVVSLLFLFFFSAVIYMGFRTAGAYDLPEDDEKVKNELLMSSSTDFSQPDEESTVRFFEHTVEPGENLTVIGRKYGVSVDTICGSNGLHSYDHIVQGRKLRIPSRDGIIIKMPKDTSIGTLAKKYQVSLEKVLKGNALANADFVPEGLELFIPDAKPLNITPGFVWPCPGRVITCGYGWRTNPFDRSRREFHQGLDIRCSYRPVIASRYGKITYTGWMGGYGNAVIIAHPNGYKTLYAHLSRINVRPGQYVKQGQTIARSGNTGRSTGPHLHFEIMKKGSHRNPHSYLVKNR